MALKMNFREVTPEDTEILRMIALRNGKAEDYLCCDVTNEDGVTQTTWYSKADVALWGEDYIRAHTTMKYSDYSGWIIILDMEPWNDTQASPRKKKKRDSFPPCGFYTCHPNPGRYLSAAVCPSGMPLPGASAICPCWFAQKEPCHIPVPNFGSTRIDWIGR